MSENSKIEWCDHTFNPWEGCQKVGPGCDHCYAETRNARFGGGVAANWGPDAPRRRTSAANWNKPRQWNANAEAFHAKHGRRQRCFCASLADVFDNQVDPQWREDLFALINATPNLDWLLLTKRIGNVAGMVAIIPGWLPANVWLGATIVNQEEANRDIPKLLTIPARVRFLSMEPLLGPVNLGGIPISGHGHHEFDPIITVNALQRKPEYPPLPKLDWIIAGGESGPGARPSHPDWYRSLRAQCAAAGVPFLFKQWGEWAPGVDVDIIHAGTKDGSMRGGKHICITRAGKAPTHGDTAHMLERVGKKAAGRLLDGIEHNGFPS